MSSTTTDRRFGAAGSLAIKAPVIAATTANITLSGEQTIDSVAVKAVNLAGIPDRVLVKNQTDATQNGIYDVATGSWTRSPDSDGNRDWTQGTVVEVVSGSTQSASFWALSTAAPITIGSSSLTFARSLANSLSMMSFIQSGTGAVTRDAQSKERDRVCVLDFYANGVSGVAVDPTGVVDSHLGIQAAINTGYTVDFVHGSYNVGTVGITFPNHNQVINGNCSTLLYSGSGHGIDETPISNVYPQGLIVNDLYVDCSASVSSGIRVRTSYSRWNNVQSVIRASNSTAWRIDTDFTYGTGPYYNQFNNCHAFGKVGITVGVSNQTGWLFTTDASAPTRGPNANVFIGGRTSQVTNPWVIAGSKNRIIAPTVEGTPSGGQVFVFENVYGGGAGCNSNEVVGPYVEGLAGANFCKFGTNALYNQMVRPYVTSLGGGTYKTDTSGGTTNGLWDERGIPLANAGSSDANVFDYYLEGTFTPVVAGSATAGANTYSVQVGTYQRRGNRVDVQISIIMTAKDAAMAGLIKITGLPYAANALANNYASLTVSDWYLSLDAGYTQVGARIDPGNQFLYVVELGSTKTVANLTPLNVYATTELIITGTYQV